MRSSVAILALGQLLSSAHAIRIIHANDDGWAELYTRSFNGALRAAGHQVVLSAPAENKSGTGSNDAEPTPRTSACQYNSCAANSGPVGSDPNDPTLNWVNSFPVTSMRYGIDQFAPVLWNGAKPELAVSGPNVGSNLWLSVHFSGTVGAAVFAAKDRGVPAIAFSGLTGGTLAYNTQPVPARSRVYAEVAAKLTQAVIASGTPYLPSEVFLNVNLPEYSDDRCNSADKFEFVLTRINPGLFSERDVTHCGTDRLPTELDVATRKNACFVSVSVGDANDKSTASRDKQAVVLQKLGSIFRCLP